MNKIKLSTIITGFAYLYVTVPILIFSYYWYNPLFCLVGFILFSITGVFIYKKGLIDNPLHIPEIKKCHKKEIIIFWIVSLIIVSIFMYFSGIGGYSFQNEDYWVRNPLYYDLCTRKWPLQYNLSENTTLVQSQIGIDNVFFVYYFSWWLSPAFIVKLFNLNTSIANVLLLTYAILGVILILFLICRIFGRVRYRYLLFLIGFNGINILEYFARYGRFPMPFVLMEDTGYFFWNNGNTVQLYRVFNQTIPIWILICLLILVSSEVSAGIGALSFAYSPWGTFGMIPIVLYKIFKENGFQKGIKKTFTPFNILIPLYLLFIYGIFYSISGNSHHGFRPTFDFLWCLTSPAKVITAAVMYILFYVIFIYSEFRFFYRMMVFGTENKCKKWKYMSVVIAELMLIPLIYFNDFNFPLRGIAPAYFLFMLLIIKFFEVDTDKKKYRKILIVLLLIGSLTSVYEIGRSIHNTYFTGLKEKQAGFISFNYMDKTFTRYISDDRISYGYKIVPLARYIEVADTQFFVHGDLGLYGKITGK